MSHSFLLDLEFSPEITTELKLSGSQLMLSIEVVNDLLILIYNS